MTQSDQAAPRNARRVITGVVSSTSMAKTITLRVERLYQHAKYKKFIRQHSKVHAHDENGEANVGDTVEVMECRPLSKTKRWRLLRVVRQSVLPAGELQ